MSETEDHGAALLEALKNARERAFGSYQEERNHEFYRWVRKY